MRQFAIIGLGNFGSTVARTLGSKGVPVIAVDRNPARVDDLRDEVTHAIVGDVTDSSFIVSSGIADVDVALIALGDDIEASVLVTLNLAECGVEEIVVKGVSEEHKRILTVVGAHRVIFPEREMAERIAMALAAPNIIDHIPLTEGYSIVELIAPELFENKSLADLNLRREYGVELLAIKRAGAEAGPKVVVVPGAGEIIHPGDKLVILGTEKDVEGIQGI